MIAVRKPDPTPTYWRTGAGMKQTTKPMRSRAKNDFYPTPLELCVEALRTAHFEVPKRWTLTILDPGCGTGVWGQAAKIIWPNCWVVGLDVDQEKLAVAEATGAYGALVHRSFAGTTLTPSFNLVIGNPPYREAEFFVRKSHNLLSPRAIPGAVLFLLRTAFVESAGRYQRLYNNDLRPYRVANCVQRPSFTEDGRTDATSYAIFDWRKWQPSHTRLDWLSWR